MPRTARKTEPQPFRLQLETYVAREAVVHADLPDDRAVRVTVSTPGTFVTEDVSVRVEVQFRNGPSAYSDGRQDDVQSIDVYAADLDALAATPTEAVRVAREQGVFPKAQQ